MKFVASSHFTRFLVFCFLLPALHNPLHAQDTDSLVTIKENGWIESLDGYIMVKLIQRTDISGITLTTPGQKFEFEQNLKSATSVGINYQFINFAINFTLKFLPGNDDNAIRGSSSNKGFGMNMIGRHWQQNLTYNQAKGYYLANTGDVDPSWHNGDPYIQFPGLTTTNYEGITAYSFNPAFSTKSLIMQTERQVRSTGSFIPQLLYRYYITEDKTPVSPSGSSQKTNNFEFALGAGYYYTLVLNRYFYFSLGAAPAAGYTFAKLTTRFPTETVYTHQTDFILRLDGRIGLGYSGRRFYGGLYASGYSSSSQQENTAAQNLNRKINAQLFFGYRIVSPAFLRRTMNTAKKHMQFKSEAPDK